MSNRTNCLRSWYACAIFIAVGWLMPTPLMAEESPATKQLKARSVELREDVVTVTDGVYTAVGYSPANVSMIVGRDGVIIVDTGMTADHARRILDEFRKLTDKPIAAIIYTHGHGDHTGGASVFAADGNPAVWSRSGFNAEAHALGSTGLTVQRARGARQAGFKLPPNKRINNGIAPAVYPKRGGAVFASGQSGFVPPTNTFSGDQHVLKIAGIELNMVAAPGETADQLYIWLPAQRVLFSGDNFYQSWPNLYAIRGTPYRDVRAWADSLDRMLDEKPEHLVPGHTRPILGEAGVKQALTDYRDAIQFVFDKTIEGMNKGLTPDELVEYVELPAHLTEKDYLQEYYGNKQWAVRSIFNGLLGWYDGNPTNLFPLSPRKEAERMAELAGGQEVLMQCARKAQADGDHQWAAQLADHLIALDPDAREPKVIKADALESLAEQLLTATGRNYYLTVAQELRSQVNE